MTILELRHSKSKPDWGIVRNQNLLRNQKRETVLECISTIFVARRPDANASPRQCPVWPFSEMSGLADEVRSRE